MELKTGDWPCPKCSSKGLNNQILAKQINSSEAIYICEGKDCLYPLEALKKCPIVNRQIGSIPVTKELLKALSLPPSLINTNLTETHVNDLLELNSLKPHINNIQETKTAWDSFVKRMVAEGEEVPTKYMEYQDADVFKLSNVQPSLKPYLSHLFNNLNENV